MKNTKKLLKGFTLIELLVVMGILALLLAITLIAINPAKQLGDAATTSQKSNATQILNAISQYQADFTGTPPSGITTSVLPISKAGADICSLLVPKYIAALPNNAGDPVTEAQCSTSYTTGFSVVKGASDNRITVSIGSISVMR